jgi:hypothetical protein
MSIMSCGTSQSRGYIAKQSNVDYNVGDRGIHISKHIKLASYFPL